MASGVVDTRMTDNQFQKLRKIVYDRSGIWFADNRKYALESRLGARLAELQMEDFDQYVMLLSIGPYRDDEFQEMFNRITINETCFFRNEPQLEVFEKRVLPELLQARAGVKRLRFWSAACSTGEEPYTLAMQVHRSLGVRLMDWRVEILGTDISEKALLAAQAGRYGTYAIRDTSPLVVRRYFRENGGTYQIDPEIQAMVRFERHNLREHLAARRFGTWDVIFCRNVMIYFDAPMRQACLKLFHEQLADDGVLFLGHSETIGDRALFEPRPEVQGFAYLKASKGGRHVAA